MAKTGMTDSSRPWFRQGAVYRGDAEDMLALDGLRDGLFLIRPSTNRAGHYVLGLVYQEKIFHHLISLVNGRFTLLGGPEHDSLAELVQYYTEHTVGDRTLLKYACQVHSLPTPLEQHPQQPVASSQANDSADTTKRESGITKATKDKKRSSGKRVSDNVQAADASMAQGPVPVKSFLSHVGKMTEISDDGLRHTFSLRFKGSLTLSGTLAQIKEKLPETVTKICKQSWQRPRVRLVISREGLKVMDKSNCSIIMSYRVPALQICEIVTTSKKKKYITVVVNSAVAGEGSYTILVFKSESSKEKGEEEKITNELAELMSGLFVRHRTLSLSEGKPVLKKSVSMGGYSDKVIDSTAPSIHIKPSTPLSRTPAQAASPAIIARRVYKTQASRSANTSPAPSPPVTPKIPPQLVTGNAPSYQASPPPSPAPKSPGAKQKLRISPISSPPTSPGASPPLPPPRTKSPATRRRFGVNPLASSTPSSPTVLGPQHEYATVRKKPLTSSKSSPSVVSVVRGSWPDREKPRRPAASPPASPLPQNQSTMSKQKLLRRGLSPPASPPASPPPPPPPYTEKEDPIQRSSLAISADSSEPPPVSSKPRPVLSDTTAAGASPHLIAPEEMQALQQLQKELEEWARLPPDQRLQSSPPQVPAAVSRSPVAKRPLPVPPDDSPPQQPLFSPGARESAVLNVAHYSSVQVCSPLPSPQPSPSQSPRSSPRNRPRNPFVFPVSASPAVPFEKQPPRLRVQRHTSEPDLMHVEEFTQQSPIGHPVPETAAQRLSCVFSSLSPEYLGLPAASLHRRRSDSFLEQLQVNVDDDSTARASVWVAKKRSQENVLYNSTDQPEPPSESTYDTANHELQTSPSESTYDTANHELQAPTYDRANHNLQEDTYDRTNHDPQAPTYDKINHELQAEQAEQTTKSPVAERNSRLSQQVTHMNSPPGRRKFQASHGSHISPFDLPDDWSCQWSNRGQAYYYYSHTLQITTWKHPHTWLMNASFPNSPTHSVLTT